MFIKRCPWDYTPVADASSDTPALVLMLEGEAAILALSGFLATSTCSIAFISVKDISIFDTRLSSVSIVISETTVLEERLREREAVGLLFVFMVPKVETDSLSN